MKLFSQLQTSIKNLIKNNKGIVISGEKGAEITEGDAEKPSPAQTQRIPMVEKYLKISDFIEYILDNKLIFLEEDLKDVKV